MAQEAIGDESNPYLQAKRILEFVREKMRFNFVRRKRGSGTISLLDHPIVDTETGEKQYEGQCDHYSFFFVALCRAAGIPARGVTGMVGWGPWMKRKDLRLRSERHKKLSPEGLAAARLYGPFGGHIWAEFYLPEYGWVPADPTWGRFANRTNYKFALSKGRDVKIGPHAPQKTSAGYGDQWIPLHKGRTNAIGYGVWNIAKIRVAKAKFLQTSDPFPADAFAEYYTAQSYPYPETQKNLALFRQRVLKWIDRNTRKSSDRNEALMQAYKLKPRARFEHDAFICHMLGKVVGDKKLSHIFRAYTNLRVETGEPVSIEYFQKIAEDAYGSPLNWFFNQWVGYTELPLLKIDAVTVSRDGEGWHICGSLSQVQDSPFQLPVELQLRTDEGEERKKIWLKKDKMVFELQTSHKPKQLIVDLNDDILKIRKTPPLLRDIWKSYPDYVVVYGTVKQTESNRAIAERFNRECLGFNERKVFVADVDANDTDLKNKCVILFGGPESNRITERFEDLFPIRLNGKSFSWRGQTYEKATQGVAQVIEHPEDPNLSMVLYGGLGEPATQRLSEASYFSRTNASYVIFERGDKELEHGLWLTDKDLFWKFEQ
jgi:hypothetical protein